MNFVGTINGHWAGVHPGEDSVEFLLALDAGNYVLELNESTALTPTGGTLTPSTAATTYTLTVASSGTVSLVTSAAAPNVGVCEIGTTTAPGG